MFIVPENRDGYCFKISITGMSEDFKQVYNYYSDLDIIDSSKDIEFIDVWDRHTCFFKSSISFMNAKSHFCKTDKFWLEFYNSRNLDSLLLRFFSAVAENW